MTLDERFAIMDKANVLEKAGKKAEADKLLIQQYPMPSYLAEFAKSHLGADFLVKNGYNLSEAEAEFGQDWLDK
jgi:hypothetical protein